MSVSHRVSPDHEVIVEHVSSLGPTATHMRGTLLVNSHENLRTLGLFEAYTAALSPRHREPIMYAIAASWIPMEVALAHYEACDSLALDPAQFAKLGELMAMRVTDTFLSSALRTTRNAGIESVWLALQHNDRLWDRMYMGGGVTVVRTGPKDLLHETHGLPLVTSRYWRSAYVHYVTAFTNLFTRASYVKAVRASAPDPHRIAVAISFV